VQQHKAILSGIKSRDPQKAREAFVQNTVRYWNRQYGLQLDERRLHIS
jgi:DNA-binding FadR family transcriptional regulator